MTVLSDKSIKRYGEKLIKPFDEKRVQPSSYDLTLYHKILRTHKHGSILDLRTDDPSEYVEECDLKNYDGSITISPGQSILGCTNEITYCPNYLTSRVEGKSTLGRIFLAIHVTAGVSDGGWEGQITLEIVNHSPWGIKLWDNMPIAQVSYFMLDSECEVPYGSKKLNSHYKGQMGPRPASGKRNYEK